MTADALTKPAALATGQVWEIEWTTGMRSTITLRAPVGTEGNSWSSEEYPGGIVGTRTLLRDANCVRARYLGTREQIATPRQVEAVLGAINLGLQDGISAAIRDSAAQLERLAAAAGPAVVLHELQGLPVETPAAHLALLTERTRPPERDRTAAEFFAGKGERYSPATGWTR